MSRNKRLSNIQLGKRKREGEKRRTKKETVEIWLNIEKLNSWEMREINTFSRLDENFTSFITLDEKYFMSHRETCNE